MSTSSPREDSSTYLIRIPIHFNGIRDEILSGLGASPIKSLDEEYLLIRRSESASPSSGSGPTPRFIRWMIPVQHAWPCNPRKMADFTEKAAQAIATKFANQERQGLFVGLLDPSSRDGYYKKLASSIRGRALQILGDEAKDFRKVEEQDPAHPSLFCMVGDGGLFAGISTPRAANGFYPGGTKFIRQNAPHMISRAGAKIAEALHYLPLYQPTPPKGAHWLELGACPGGMTSELLEQGYRVTALDRAPLDARLKGHPRLRFLRTDSAAFEPEPKVRFDALLCDMNGETTFSLSQIVRLSRALKPGALIVFTLKTAGVSTYSDLVTHFQTVLQQAKAGGLSLITGTHLTYNRHEFTLFLRKS
ncbi:MAG: SAM-dependent methyltransferase [Verrucomicrobiales bacterium]